MPTQYELLDDPPKYAGAVARLWSWSENYDFPSPASVFLDLVGYSHEHMGEPLCSMDKVPQILGYLEMDMLADALREYADRPQDVMIYVESLLFA